MSAKRKYNELNLADNLAALADIKGGMSVRAVAAKYNISVGTVSRLSKREENLKDRVQNNESLKSTRPARVAGATATIDELSIELYELVPIRSRDS
jgi:transposase